MAMDIERLDRIIAAAREHSSPSYWCRHCNRSLQPEVYDNGLVYIHDDIPHPANYMPECGGGHRLH